VKLLTVQLVEDGHQGQAAALNHPLLLNQQVPVLEVAKVGEPSSKMSDNHKGEASYSTTDRGWTPGASCCFKSHAASQTAGTGSRKSWRT
jgi:hypothetical protein